MDEVKTELSDNDAHKTILSLVDAFTRLIEREKGQTLTENGRQLCYGMTAFTMVFMLKTKPGEGDK